MATNNYGWTELDLDDEANIGQVNVPLNQIDSTVKRILDERDNYAGGYWTTYTPGWQTGGTSLRIENGTLSGRYRRIGGPNGRLVVGEIHLTRGSDTNVGSGTYEFGLPINARDNQTVNGGGWTRDVSAGREYSLQIRGHRTGFFRCILGRTEGDVNFAHNNPYSPADGDIIKLGFWYEVS